MKIWTTPQLQELILEKGLPVTLRADHEIRESYLRDAALGDAAVLPVDDEYLKFLTDAAARGFRGPILFISAEPVMAYEGPGSSQVVILDLKRMGTATVRQVVTVIIRLVLERLPAGVLSPSPGIDRERDAEQDGPQVADINIPQTLSALLADKNRVILAFHIYEEYEPVTVRGTCLLKALSDGTMLLGGFKPASLIKGIRPGSEVSLLFSRGEYQFHATLKNARHSSDELVADHPDRIFFVRRRFFRVEPSLPRPVTISLLLPNEPTEFYKTLDISQQGFGFNAPGKFEHGKVYACTIILPEPFPALVCYGMVRCKRESANVFRYGVELQIHPRDEDIIAGYVMQRELQILALLENL